MFTLLSNYVIIVWCNINREVGGVMINHLWDVKYIIPAKVSIEQARAVIRNAFEADGGNEPGSFKHSYISEMAMLLYDRYDVPVKLANEQAIALLDLIFAE